MVSSMSHMDEQIIAMIHEAKEAERMQGQGGADGELGGTAAESEKEAIPGPVVRIGKELVPFEERTLLDGRIRLTLPKAFRIMPPHIAALKYPSQHRPGIIYTNDICTINVSLNYSQSALEDEDMEEFVEAMVQVLKRSQPQAKFLEEGLIPVDGQTVGYIDFIAQGLDDNLYNLMFFAAVDGRALLCTFNCLAEDMDVWKRNARGIMKSLRFDYKAQGGAAR
jgi:hypothetical protein